LDLLDNFFIGTGNFRNLVSLFKLNVVGYSFKYENGCFSLYKHTCTIETGTLSNGLYKLNLDNLYAKTLMTLHLNVGTKHGLVNECSAYL